MIGKSKDAGLEFDSAAMQAHAFRVIGRTIKTAEASAGAEPIQSMYDNVLTRRGHDATYRPQVLRDYFKRIGDRRGNDK